MDTLLIMLKNVVIFVLLAVPGYLLVRGKLLTGKDSGALSGLLTYVGMPGLILSSTLKLEFTGEFTRAILLTGALGVLFMLFMFAASGLLLRDSDSKRRGMARFCVVFSNNGFVGIPLARAVFGEGSPVVAHLIVLNIIMNVLMFTLGAYLVSGDKKTVQLKKAILNPVLLAFLAGIVLNLMKVSTAVPEIQTYATYFSGIVTPLSMLVLGIKLAQIPIKKLFTSRRMYYVAAVRLVLFPVICIATLLALRLIPALAVDTDTVAGFFIGFAMPTAGLATVFADRHKGDTENAVIFTLGTTVLSVVTIPVLYALLELIL